MDSPAVLAANRGSGTGTVRFDPAPVAIPNETVQYLPDGQPTNLVATADADFVAGASGVITITVKLPLGVVPSQLGDQASGG